MLSVCDYMVSGVFIRTTGKNREFDFERKGFHQEIEAMAPQDYVATLSSTGVSPSRTCIVDEGGIKRASVQDIEINPSPT